MHKTNPIRETVPYGGFLYIGKQKEEAMFGKLFKKEEVYVQEPNPKQSRQLFYVSISKDAIISKAKEQGISVTDGELDSIRAELFDKVMKDADISIKNHLLIRYCEVADEVITAFGIDTFKSYKKVLMGVEIALPTNKSKAECVLITKHDKTYTMTFSGKGILIPVTDISLEQVVSVFTAITGIAVDKVEIDIIEAA